jgi:hypothetical protein
MLKSSEVATTLLALDAPPVMDDITAALCVLACYCLRTGKKEIVIRNECQPNAHGSIQVKAAELLSAHPLFRSSRWESWNALLDKVL